MTDPRQRNRSSWLHAATRLLLPNAFDARVLSIVVFWLAMMVTSAMSRTGLPRIDAVDLWLPWWAGLAGVLSALVLLMRRPQRRTFFYAGLAIGVGLVLHFTAARVMGIRDVPEDVYGGGPSGLPIESIDELLSNGWVLASLALGGCLAIQMLIAVVRRGFKRGQSHESGEDSSSSSRVGLFNRLVGIRPFILKHRVGVMAGFVAVMIPLIVLRNVFDPDSHSTPYLVLPAVLFALIVSSILVLPVLARLMAKAGWSHWAFLLFVIATVGAAMWCWDDFQRGLNRGKFDVGKTFALASFAMMFLGTLIAGVVDPSKSGSHGRFQVSLFSPLLVLLTLGGLWYCQRTYDARVVAISLAQSPREFLDGDWVDVAKQSRDLMRLTNGAAMSLPDRYQPRLEVQIRDERDADVIDVLSKKSFTGRRGVRVRNVQPFVNLSFLANGFSSVRFIGGELSDDQLMSMAGRLDGMAFDSVKLPTVLGNRLKLINVTVSSDSHDDGLSAFLDACGRQGTRFIYLDVPLTRADWESVVRVSSKTTYVRTSSRCVPANAFSSTVITSATDLSNLSVHVNEKSSLAQFLKLAIENGLNILGMGIDVDRHWDFVMAAPNIWDWVMNVPRGDRDVTTYVNDCRWAYGWDDERNITHVWMPGIMLRADELAELSQLKTLRLDCRGFMDPLVPTLGPLSVLSDLAGLEQLSLTDAPVDSLEFLAGLASLKHLQIYAPEANANVPGSFAVCKNLQTLRLFGAPIPSTVQQLASLPQLRRVEVIDDRIELLNPAKVAKLRASLPGIEVVVTPTASYDPELSELFLKQRANVRGEVMEWIEAEIAQQSRRNDDP